jgi:hypothetical protein
VPISALGDHSLANHVSSDLRHTMVNVTSLSLSVFFCCPAGLSKGNGNNLSWSWPFERHSLVVSLYLSLKLDFHDRCNTEL